MKIHQQINRGGFQSNVFVESALVDMYAKCESIEKAREEFDKMHERNVVSWIAMIAGYSSHGLPEEALAPFLQMRGTKTQPSQHSQKRVMSYTVKPTHSWVSQTVQPSQ